MSLVGKAEALAEAAIILSKRKFGTAICRTWERDRPIHLFGVSILLDAAVTSARGSGVPGMACYMTSELFRALHTLNCYNCHSELISAQFFKKANQYTDHRNFTESRGDGRDTPTKREYVIYILIHCCLFVRLC